MQDPERREKIELQDQNPGYPWVRSVQGWKNPKRDCSGEKAPGKLANFQDYSYHLLQA